MRIAICDDCREDALYLNSLLMRHEVAIFSDTKILLEEIERMSGRYDLYLLDIYMGNSAEGISLAKNLREIDEDASICFVSSSDEFYREAYDLYDVNYLLKPVQETVIKQLIERVQRRISRNKEQTLTFKFNGQMGSIPYGEILFISSDGHYISIYCKDGHVQECKEKLNEMAERLNGEIFVRCHQSFLVNIYQVDNLNGSDLMIGKYRIPVSRRYHNELKNRYHEILFEEVE